MSENRGPLKLTGAEIAQQIEAIRRGVADGTIPLWTGDEPLSSYLERARSLQV